MAEVGEGTIDFGTSGETNVTMSVVRPEMLAGSHVEAYLFPRDTADHTVDEHIIDGPLIYAHDISAGVGFSVSGVSRNGDVLFGAWTFRWVSTD